MASPSGPIPPFSTPRPLSQSSTFVRSPPPSSAGSTAPGDASSRSQSSSTLTIRPASHNPGGGGPTGGLRYPSNRKTIYDRNLSRSRNAELSKAGFAYIFAEMVGYAQKRVTGIQDLEKRLADQGYPIGLRLLCLLTSRSLPTSSSGSSSSSSTNASLRPTRILPLLQFLTTTLWRALFSRPADSLERSATKTNEYMLADNDPLTSAYVSVPKEMSMFNPGAFIAGVIEACCDGLGMPAKVSAHNAGNEMWPMRTVWLVAFEEGVVRREEALARAEKDGKR